MIYYYCWYFVVIMRQRYGEMGAEMLASASLLVCPALIMHISWLEFGLSLLSSLHNWHNHGSSFLFDESFFTSRKNAYQIIIINIYIALFFEITQSAVPDETANCYAKVYYIKCLWLRPINMSSRIYIVNKWFFCCCIWYRGNISSIFSSKFL